MKKCPECGEENKDEALECVSCGEKLETPSPPGPKPTPTDPASAPTTVATFHHLPDADLLMSRLQAAGIEAYIPEEYSAQIFSDVIGLESVSVCVAAKDYEAAKAIASEHAAASISNLPGNDPSTSPKPEP